MCFFFDIFWSGCSWISEYFPAILRTSSKSVIAVICVHYQQSSSNSTFRFSARTANNKPRIGVMSQRMISFSFFWPFYFCTQKFAHVRHKAKRKANQPQRSTNFFFLSPVFFHIGLLVGEEFVCAIEKRIDTKRKYIMLSVYAILELSPYSKYANKTENDRKKKLCLFFVECSRNGLEANEENEMKWIILWWNAVDYFSFCLFLSKE